MLQAKAPATYQRRYSVTSETKATAIEFAFIAAVIFFICVAAFHLIGIV